MSPGYCEAQPVPIISGKQPCGERGRGMRPPTHRSQPMSPLLPLAEKGPGDKASSGNAGNTHVDNNPLKPNPQQKHCE